MPAPPREQAREAIAAARRAFPSWSRSGLLQRHAILRKTADELLARKDEIGRLLAREEGKTLPEGIAETGRAAQIFDFFAGEALRLTGETVPSVRPGIGVEMTREPMGVVGLITPWNFPVAIPAWKIAPALCHGNTVVFKPAELTPGCAWEIADILHRAGLPRGVLNLVMGKGSVVGQAILDSPDVAAVSFTGSVSTGRRVAAACAENMRKVQLEMGGKNPLVVLDDADLDTAVEVAVNGAFYSTGQRCTASSRLVVQQGIHDRFVDAVTERLKKLVVGDALKEGTQIGPVVDQRQLDQDLKYHRDRPRRGRRAARLRRRAAEPRDAGLLPPAGAPHRVHERHAHQPRGDLRPGRQRHPRQGLRGGAARRQRHALRPVLGHLHDEPQARHALQAQRRGRHGDGQPADGRRRLPRPLRRLARARATARANRAATPRSSTPT